MGMDDSVVSRQSLSELSLWEKMRDEQGLLSFDLEVTARCNNNCRHCCINLPATDQAAREQELSIDEIEKIASEAVSLGALWCLITGGEPLLREDFAEIYLTLKRKGLLVSVFTNASLVTAEHVRLFERYPPRDIEVTVYGVHQQTYEQVTRRRGSFDAFMRGLDLLIESGVRVRLKAMALRSNVHEFPEIARFCGERTKDYFRFDPFLNLRYDGDAARNREIRAERLLPEEIVALERAHPSRFEALQKCMDKLIVPQLCNRTCQHLFHCGAGTGSLTLSYNGLVRLCSSLWHPDCVYDLKEGSLSDAWDDFVPRVREMRSNNIQFLSTCRVCPLINLCMWCPAHAHLETGGLDQPVPYFCAVAHARAEALRQSDRAQLKTHHD